MVSSVFAQEKQDDLPGQLDDARRDRRVAQATARRRLPRAVASHRPGLAIRTLVRSAVLNRVLEECHIMNP